MKKLLALFLATGAIIAISGLSTAYAAPSGAPGKPDKVRPTLVAVAIGSVKEADGGRAIVEFRAAQRGEGAAGNLRFYSPETGYYNGGVKKLSVEGDIIKAAGAGPLTRTDGERVAVHYQAEFNQRTKQVTIHVQGREGLDYSIEGAFDPGFIKADAPPAPKASKTKP